MVAVYGIPTVMIFIMFTSSFYIPCRYCMLPPSVITLADLAVLGWIHYDAMLSGTATDAMSLTGTLMIMAVKISMFGYHMHDGLKVKTSPETPLSVMPHIDTQRRQTAIIVAPSFAEYMAYQFDFMGGLVGPILTYREYMDFINREGDFIKISSTSFRDSWNVHVLAKISVPWENCRCRSRSSWWTPLVPKDSPVPDHPCSEPICILCSMGIDRSHLCNIRDRVRSTKAFHKSSKCEPSRR
jgi:hypothetical protein